MVINRVLTARLEILNSKTDVNGNRYWAFRFTDYATGKVVEAVYSGGESNASAMCHDWNGNGTGWDQSIETHHTEMGIRDFNRTVKGWPYAGCLPEELRAFIKSKL